MAHPNRVKANNKYRRGIGFGQKAQKQVPTIQDNTDTYTSLSTENNV